MPTPDDVITVAHAIQQAVAPVFLLTGVGAILSVLTNRLARVIDRLRTLEKLDRGEYDPHADEVALLWSRARLAHWAISLCTISALFICIVIAALFVGSELGRDPSGTIALFFIAAMLALIVGLLCFLREIALAMGAVKATED